MMLILGLLENAIMSIVKRLLLIDLNALSYVCPAVSLILVWSMYNIINQIPKTVGKRDKSRDMAQADKFSQI